MNIITLKYPAIQVPTESEQQDVLEIYADDSVDTTTFTALIRYAEENQEEYKNPSEILNSVVVVRDATPTVNDEKMDTLVRNMQNHAVQIHQVLADSYESYSKEEKSYLDIINRLESELETRRFLPLAIEAANTSIDYFECATLASSLFDEEEVVFQLFKNSIKLLENNVGTANYSLNTYIEKTNLSEIQKVELKIQLQNKVKLLK